MADDFEALYSEIAARRHRRRQARRSATAAERDFIHVDLHMHTDHSPDCATPVDTLLDTAKRVGLGVIAITDHNEISGALEARERADGIKVIVAEEVKTADQGEVIGLFIEEKIPRGMTLQETIAEIRRQGGLIYVPHPFDRMHAVPDYEHLLDVVEDIDAIEVLQPARRLLGLQRGGGPVRGQVPDRRRRRLGLATWPRGSARSRSGCGTSTGPRSSSSRCATPTSCASSQSLLYVQALKFIQTSGKK